MNFSINKLWDMVNSIDSLAEAERVKELVDSADITNDEWEALVNTIACLVREIYHTA